MLCLVLGVFGPLDRIVLFVSEAFTALENWHFAVFYCQGNCSIWRELV